MTREIILLEGGGLATLPNKEDIENLSISTLPGKVYYACKEEDIRNSKNDHMIYKLHKIMLQEIPDTFVWVAMWNSEVYLSVKKEGRYDRRASSYKHNWDTIEESMIDVLSSGYKVIRGDAKTMERIKWSMKSETQ